MTSLSFNKWICRVSTPRFQKMWGSSFETSLVDWKKNPWVLQKRRGKTMHSRLRPLERGKPASVRSPSEAEGVVLSIRKGSFCLGVIFPARSAKAKFILSLSIKLMRPLCLCSPHIKYIGSARSCTWKKKKNPLIYLRLRWAFLVARGSLVAASGASSSQCTASPCGASLAVEHRL